MKTLKHPSEFIEPLLISAIRNTAAEAEQLKQLDPAQLQIIHEQKWFQLFVPKQFGGMELRLPEALRLEEAIAWTDGSVGWTVTLCAGAGWFIGFLNPEIVPIVFTGDKVCLAGSGKPSGIAKIYGDAYTITGAWDYATGSNIATAFTVNCMVEEYGALLKNPDGSPVIRSFLFLRNEVTIRNNWKPMGMIATGSNSFEVKELVVYKNSTFQIDSSFAVLKQPIYTYPFLQFAETTLAVNSSGMSIRFLDLCKKIFDRRSDDKLQSVLQHAFKEIENAREQFYNIVEKSWKECVDNMSITSKLLQGVSNASRQLAYVSRRVVDDLYPYCGMQAANPATEINRVWRNLHTASQHSLFNHY